MPDRIPPDILSDSITTLRGIGPKKAEQFERLGVGTLYDLVCFFPRSLADWSRQQAIGDLQDGEECAFVATVSQKPSLRRKGRFSILRTVLRDETGALAAVWFNQPYHANRLEKGTQYLFRGRIRRDGSRFEIHNPVFEAYDPDAPQGPSCQPIYPLTQGLRQAAVRMAIADALDQTEGLMPEPLPAWVRRDHQLCTVAYAYRNIHQPESPEAYEIARRRLAFEEMFLVQAGLRMVKGRLQAMTRAYSVPDTDETDARLQVLTDALPFTLTSAQQRAVAEIRADLTRTFPMNRLLQGDVGSGKTVVAALALYAAVLGGYQGALLAPTSVLAEQHLRTLQAFFSGTEGRPFLNVALLTGATRASDRKEILANLADGSLPILVGTHALLEERVQFRNLGLAITDEQHRFGVRQRTVLSGAAEEAEPERTEPEIRPHVLVMSATPIPRSLALMLYGDLDISVLDELPAGRQAIETYAAASSDWDRVTRLIRKQADSGRQAFVVCPMIEESDEEDENPLESVESTYRRLTEDLPSLAIGLMYGSLKAAEKQETMERFHAGDIQVLVTTTVIEVGVDNPNASLMVVQNAERFGLAQIHQLRGRIGRGPYRSYCVLISDAQDPVARERIRTLCTERDGFKIAEKDLELRGPGDFFGTRQHGIPAFRIANLYRDAVLLGEVSTCLDRVMEADPGLTSRDSRQLVPAIRLHFADVFPTIGI